MKVYSDLYIEFADDGIDSCRNNECEWRIEGIDCVKGSYMRGGLIKRKESYYSYEFKNKVELKNVKLNAIELIADSIAELAHKGKPTLLVGLGNYHYTADALGAAVLDKVSKIDGITKLYPQCKGVTGIDSFELLKCAVKLIAPSSIIIIDSLATNRLNRLGRVIQLTDGGITPGGGLNISGNRLSSKELGAPTIAIGVPLIIKAEAINAEAVSLNNPLLTSAVIDEMLEDMSDIIAGAINNCMLRI